MSERAYCLDCSAWVHHDIHAPAHAQIGEAEMRHALRTEPSGDSAPDGVEGRGHLEYLRACEKVAEVLASEMYVGRDDAAIGVGPKDTGDLDGEKLRDALYAMENAARKWEDGSEVEIIVRRRAPTGDEGLAKMLKVNGEAGEVEVEAVQAPDGDIYPEPVYQHFIGQAGPFSEGANVVILSEDEAGQILRALAAHPEGDG